MFSKEKDMIAKIPTNDMEALKSNLMSLFEKKRFLNFYKYID
jgi:RAB protein geranylgeranyltransferase component A